MFQSPRNRRSGTRSGNTRPSDQQFKEALSGKGQAFINADITPDDVTRAAAIYGGMAEQLLMGKMTRK